MGQYLSCILSLYSITFGRFLWKTISTPISVLALRTAHDQVQLHHHMSLNIAIVQNKQTNKQKDQAIEQSHIVSSTHPLRAPLQYMGAF